MKIQGKLHAIMDAQQITDSFKKREFVVEFAENPMYPQLIKFETTQDRCELLDSLKVGEQLDVTFNLKGREWTSPDGEKKYFTTLDAWKIDKMSGEVQQVSVGEGENFSKSDPDDLPF